MTWESIELGDVLSVKHGWAFKSQYFESEGPFVVVTPGNFFEKGGFRHRPGKDRSYSGEFSNDYLLEEDDLIIAMTEQGPGLLGSSALVPSDQRFLHNQRIGRVLIKDEEKIDRYYLYHLFNTRNVRGQIYGSATGTKVRHTAPERIYRVKADIPDLISQRRIASIISSYDALIENNRRRIELLEKSARLLYREWFVHFRFPRHETTKYVDGVPEGWIHGNLGDICETNIESHKKGKLPSLLRYIDIGSVSQGSINNVTEYKAEDAPGRARRIAQHGDTIWSNVRPNLKAYSLVMNPQENDIFSTGFTVLHPKEVSPFYLYLCVTTDDFVGHLVNHATGASYPAVRPDDFERAPAIKPCDRVMKEFHEVCLPIYETRDILARKNKSLMKARDFLLPRLMDARIEV